MALLESNGYLWLYLRVDCNFVYLYLRVMSWLYMALLESHDYLWFKLRVIAIYGFS